jgi:uncharacterized protein YodC (DUF2158 family)
MSINQDTPPDERPLQPGDQVSLKGVDGPKMVVNSVRCKSEVVCFYWDKECSRFIEATFHSNALAIHDAALSGGKHAPVTVSRTMLETALRNGAHLIRSHSMDYTLMRECFAVVRGELLQHVDMEGHPC